MYDIVIKGGRVIDGTGKDSFIADIGIEDERIVKIGSIDISEGKEVIDAKNLIVTPGFIDTHSHGDGTILLYPCAQSAIRQGITTFVGGTCGDSPAPISEKYYMRHFWEYDAWYDVDNHTYYANFVQPREKAVSLLEKKFSIKFDWNTYEDWLRKIEDTGISINIIPLLGHGTIRAHSMGPVDSDRIPTKQEMDTMKKYIREAMESGAWGFSTGLDYIPSAYASTEEIVELAKVVSEYNGIYSTHWRRTGIRKATTQKRRKIDGLIEACEIAERAGLRVEISHILPGYDVYPFADDEVERAIAKATLKVVDEALDKGVNVAFNVIPNTTGGFECIPYLVMYFAPWVRQAGSIDQFVKNLNSFDFREELREKLLNGKWYKVNPVVKPEWDKQMIVTRSINDEYIGKSIEEIGHIKGGESIDTIFDLIIEDPHINVRQDGKNNASIDEFLKHEKAMLCVDSYVYDEVGPFGIGMDIPEILPNPTAFCAFPRYILNYGSPRIEDTIRKITGAPAEWYGLKQRGKVKEGNFADIVVMDLENLKTNENHIEPRHFPDGINYVLVNGKTVVRDSKHTGERSGKVLRHNKPEIL